MARSERHRRQLRVREATPPRYAPSPRETGVAGILLDSDIVIEILRGRAKVVRDLLAIETRQISTYCCAIAWAEVTAGLRPGEEAVTDAFFAARGDVVIDAAMGRRAGAYLARYRQSHGVELADAMVAAAATTAGLHLWTLNKKHYPMADLQLYDPPADE
ncbi:MAG: PIN domain nuclease [Candidatus Rokuibacteriota bacterium]|nr:MAG: PIN domain nuclease [Candidatus Rokubacteria bacterium]